MPLFSSNYDSFGLDVSELSLKAVQLKKTKKGFAVSAFAETILPEGIIENGMIKDRQKLAAAITELLKKGQGTFTSKYVACCLPEIKSYVKLIHLQRPDRALADPENFERYVRSQMTNHIPIPLDEAHIDWQVAPHEPGSPDFYILAGAIPKDVVKDYTETLRLCRLIPLALEIEAQSIIRALFGNAPTPQEHTITLIPEKNASRINKIKNMLERLTQAKKTRRSPSFGSEIIVDSGATRTSCILWSKGTIQFTSSHPIAGNILTKTLSEQLKIDKDEAEKTKKICGLDPTKCKGKPAKVMQGFAKDLARVLKDMIAYHSSHTEDAQNIERIILVGGNAHLSGLPDILTKQIGVPVVVGEPTLIDFDAGSKTMIPQGERLSFTTAIGLALRGKSL